jgi:hypothetical protein
VTLETAADQRPHRWRRGRRQRVPVRISGQDLRQRIRHGVAGERLRAGQHLVEQSAERSDVRTPIDRPAARLFRVRGFYCSGGGVRQ